MPFSPTGHKPPVLGEVGDHALGSGCSGDKDSTVFMMEYPQPPILVADAEAGFVGTQSGSGQELGTDQVGLRGKGLARCLQHVDESTFADIKTEQIRAELRQAFEAMREAQIDHQGVRIVAVGRALLPIGGRRGFELFRAARTGPAMQRHAPDLRFNRRDFDVIIGLESEPGLVETSAPHCWQWFAITSRLFAGWGCRG